MTNEEIEALGKRAVASKHFRWMPGMLATHRWTGPIRVVTCDGVTEDPCLVIKGGPLSTLAEDYGIMRSWPACEGSVYPVLPVLEDPATLGCMPHLVREAWNALPTVVPWWLTIHEGEGFMVEIYNAFGQEHTFEKRDLAYALVEALEAAP